MNRPYLPLAVVLLLALCVEAALAGRPCCERCGCETHVKKICRLVRVEMPVELPTYECAPTKVFCPDKGKLCHSGYRCDTFCTLHRNCDGTRSCCCATRSGCQTLYGAKPTGAHSTCCVRAPSDNQPTTVSVMKWVTIHVCRECCDSRNRKR